ncbi:leucine zipper domain-containing protein [Kamptonema sp. UHCC 0994]|uniref:leucine zipper domain-containing protein n=1 Tax=Kamptonema sp. UHCC 0994 TaxID=3031329 RepID=UPI0023B92DA3|nr:leucine zipper domain-containing protein [Kamptonema sp. UHCC 0994]MDF0554332.1 leucine zipper domain-containing protein [Kamptonema sp. UHCC 0994]
MSLHQRGISDLFNELIETRIRQIIQVAKLQGQSIQTTLQTLDRFYAEGLMGEMQQGSEPREQTLAAWRRQLERLWPEVEP